MSEKKEMVSTSVKDLADSLGVTPDEVSQAIANVDLDELDSVAGGICCFADFFSQAE
ncbi:MAG: hypothetical protein GY856_07810 [bacterium]|nr:hypothetical protein [bacterium]